MSEFTYTEFFKTVAGDGNFPPYPYQIRLACGDDGNDAGGRDECESMLIDVPTGMGKTAAVTMAWLWNRVVLENGNWPRRLVYCLPMRTLVEQTRDCVKGWLRQALEFEKARPSSERSVDRLEKLEWLAKNSPVILMGGEKSETEQKEWDLYPEREAILIGTQDMLLSRVLNRGYGMSRFRWPMHFGLLNNDCLWVLDETQLMGVGLSTSAQMHAFRERFFSEDTLGCQTWWMSATLNPDWLATVDFDPASLPAPESLRDNDFSDPEIDDRWRARKGVSKISLPDSVPNRLAPLVLELASQCEGEFVLVIVNTVKRALEIREEVDRLVVDRSDTEVILVHSRYRRKERDARLAEIMAKQATPRRIVISTQVVEAGVDISAKILVTDLASWPSMIQRFGRCNRKGKASDASVHWIDLDESKAAAPYSEDALTSARRRLEKLDDASPECLATFPVETRDIDPFRNVLRERDLVGLFDTTPDLSGGDIDVSRFIRERDDLSVQVFWRDWKQSGKATPPPIETAAPHRDELCPVPVGDFRGFAFKSGKPERRPFRWDHVDSAWVRVEKDEVYPGQTYLLHAAVGGYSGELGWTGDPGHGPVPVVDVLGTLPEGDESDAWALSDWRTIREHTEEVVTELDRILDRDALVLPSDVDEAMRVSARWHDWGKAHFVFQNAVLKETDGEKRPADFRDCREIAKAPGRDRASGHPGWWKRYGRRHFRHELASALAMLQPAVDLGLATPEQRDLAAYLAAAHHGRVRLSIRSFPDEKPPDDSGKRFARGIHDRDILPPVDLGGGTGPTPEVTLSLEPMEIGLGESPPFVDLPSWTERTVALRASHGPMRLAFYEAVLRAADMRGSGLAARKFVGDLRNADEDERADRTMEEPPRGGAAPPPSRHDPRGGGPQHVDGERAGGSGLAEGTSQPVDATRTIDTVEGVLKYSEVAARLAGRIVEVAISLQNGDYQADERWDSLARTIHRDICSHLVPDWAGEFRDLDVRVGTHEPPPHWKVPVEMAEFTQGVEARWQYLLGDDDGLLHETLAWIESRFLAIHPFKDFNGRVVRLLMAEVLRRAELPVVEVGVETEQRRQEYFTALRAADQMDFSLMMEIWRRRLAGGGE
ncbi:MAG: DEAD/DEAH box helicase [Verrucomicrobiales bacterium]